MAANHVDLTGSDDDDDDAVYDTLDPVQRETNRREKMRITLASAQVVPIPVSRNVNAPRAAVPQQEPPPAKRAKPELASAAVYVLAKGDWPRSSSAKLVNVKVLGTYTSQAMADAAKAAYLQRGGWQEGYGYHQGEDAESRIEIYRTVLDAPAR